MVGSWMEGGSWLGRGLAQGSIVRGAIGAGGNCPGGVIAWGVIGMGGTWPGEIVPRAISRGVIVRGAIVQGELSCSLSLHYLIIIFFDIGIYSLIQISYLTNFYHRGI